MNTIENVIKKPIKRLKFISERKNILVLFNICKNKDIKK